MWTCPPESGVLIATLNYVYLYTIIIIVCMTSKYLDNLLTA